MSPETREPSDIPFRETSKVPVGWLKLDRGNPRLVGSSPPARDEEIIAQFYRGEELSELLQSISANPWGYMDIEPLIVVIDDEDGAFIVTSWRWQPPTRGRRADCFAIR